MRFAGPRVRQVSGHRGEPALRVPQMNEFDERARDVSIGVGAVVGPPGGVIGRIWPAVIVVVPIVSEPGPEPTEAMAVTIMAAAAVMERKPTPHMSARRSPKAPSAHSAEVASREAAAEVASGEAARVAAPANPTAPSEPTRVAAPSEAAASVAAAPSEAAAASVAASAASAAPAGVRCCCNGASGERASEQNDHHLFQHLSFPSWPPVSLAAVAELVTWVRGSNSRCSALPSLANGCCNSRRAIARTGAIHFSVRPHGGAECTLAMK